MIPTQIALRLIALRQAALAETGGLRRSMNRAYSDDVAVWGAWLQTHPDDLTAVLHLLITEIAVDRQLHCLDVVEAPTPIVPADPPVEISVAAGMLAPLPDAGTLDRAAVEATLHDGSTVTARPARVA